MENYTNVLTVGAIVLGIIFIFTVLLMFVKKNYYRIPPNTAAVVFGRKQKIKLTKTDGTQDTVEKGYRVLTGGGVLKIPILEEIQFLNLSNRMLNVQVNNAPNKDGVMTTVEGVANVKFSSELGLLGVAVERFLTKPDKEIDSIILQNLEGHLRAVVGRMTMEQLIGDKSALNSAVLDEANDDFNKMGINIDFLNIQDIRDNVNYIINMGRKRAAEIKRDADIGTAEAERDALKKTSIAEKDGIEVANANQERIFESNKAKDVKAAEMKAFTDRENEIANQAGPLSQAEALKRVVEARAATQAADERAQIDVQQQRAIKEAKRYEAEIVVPANANRDAQVINADASKQAMVIKAEGEKLSIQRIAEGQAEATKIKKIADAEGDAAIIERTGMAEGAAIYAKLSAEAKGIKEKAEAYALLDQTGKFLEILNALQTLGPNLVKEFAGVMAASSSHLSNVKDVKIIDFGGSGKSGSSVGNFGTAPVEILTKMFTGLQGTGFDMSKLLDFLGISAEQAQGLLQSNIPETKDQTVKSPKPKQLNS